MKSASYTLASLLFLFSCTSTTPSEVSGTFDYAITNVNLVTMTSPGVTTGRAVFIKDGVIQKIVSEKSVKPGQADHMIDAKGAFLVPGLAEMHAHIPQPGPGPDKVKETLLLYLSQGVTTIRGMLGHPSHLELREKVNAGEVLGPRIYTSGPSFNGNSVPTAEVAREMVKEQKAAGYDFMKLHPGIKRDVFDSMVVAANSENFGYSGHVSTLVGIRRALESGYGTVDHIDGYLEGLVPNRDQLDPNSNGFFGLNWVPMVDMSLLDELISLTLENGVAVVPTQSLMERWLSPKPAEEILSEPEMIYMSPQTREQWKNTKKNFEADPSYSQENADKMNEIRREMLKRMHEAGVTIILGSDAPQVFNVPGFSAHHELKSLVNAGLTPFEALKTGTINAAAYFGQQGKFGEISEGASADLVLVKKNPLDDVANMDAISWVMVRGQMLDRKFLDEELGKIAAMYRE